MDVIATHINADFDCLGSMIAAKRLYPDAVLVFPGGQERGLRHFLLESSLYAYDIKRPKDIDLKKIKRLILVDVRSAVRIGPLAEVARRSDIELHIYDHHPRDENSLQGTFEIIRDVGATTTILTQLFMERDITPSADEATMMMLGLFEDTGHLLFSSTTPDDFRAAAYLLEQGANLNMVADFLVREMTPEQVELLNDLLKSTEQININGVQVAVASASTDSYSGDISTLVHKLKDIENLDILIAVVRMEDRVFIVARSRVPQLHVGELLREFGGGGHAFAASATVRDKPLAQVLKEIEQLLPRFVQSYCDARHLMSRSVKSLPLEATIQQARELMTRYNFNAVPIVRNDGKVAGIVTRQVVEKAAHHRLHKVPVAEVMNSDFEQVAPTASLQELQRVIVEHQQRSVPVVDQGQLVGLVTRTDLLRYMLGNAGATEEGERQHLERRGLQTRRKNLDRYIATQLPPRVRKLLLQLGSVADESGVRAYLVGGFVRDLLLRQKNLDIDVVVEGDGITFAKAFAARASCRIREHEKFGTAVIIFPDGFKIDVASARIEYYDRPATLPQVEDASIRHDLYRRDFTINTLTVALNPDHFGVVLDFYGGQRDLRDKSIRVLHNLSFIEDPTRLYRAVRFEQRLNFHIGRQTERLMHSAVELKMVRKVGGVRILNELKHILDETQNVPALERLNQFGLLQIIDSRIIFDADAKKLFKAAEQAISWYELLYTGMPCRRWLVFLVCLFDQLPVGGLRKLSRWFSLRPDEKVVIVDELPQVIRLQRKILRLLGRQHQPANSEIYHWFAPFAIESLLYLMARTEHERGRQWISRYVTDLRREQVMIDGHDLVRLGLAPGPEFQTIFRHLLDARLDGFITTRDDELDWVRQHIPGAARQSDHNSSVDPKPQVN
ncbi:MAG TPA: CBS domain-containing protein [Pelovirga sp.]|nr:CBS domain-containing protein [Pelovirga sp.]